MYRGKHANKTKTTKKTLVLLTALFLIFTVTAGSTLAYLVTKTDPVVNTFLPTSLTGDIVEDFDNKTVKKEVKVSNTSTDVDAYVRVALVMTWQKKNAETEKYEVAPVAVTENDYTITGLNTTDWKPVTDSETGITYYYYRNVLEKNETTAKLFDSLTISSTANVPEGYTLVVDVLTQGVQAEPEQAVKEVWGVNSSDFIHEEN